MHQQPIKPYLLQTKKKYSTEAKQVNLSEKADILTVNDGISTQIRAPALLSAPYRTKVSGYLDTLHSHSGAYLGWQKKQRS